VILVCTSSFVPHRQRLLQPAPSERAGEYRLHPARGAAPARVRSATHEDSARRHRQTANRGLRGRPSTTGKADEQSEVCQTRRRAKREPAFSRPVSESGSRKQQKERTAGESVPAISIVLLVSTHSVHISSASLLYGRHLTRSHAKDENRSR
jgi:hypothetical protein